MFVFSKSGWQIQLLSPESGALGKAFVNLAMAMKQLFRQGGAVLEFFSSLKFKGALRHP